MAKTTKIKNVKPTLNPTEIDEEVVNLMLSDNVMDTLASDQEMRRAELNFFAETLVLMQNMAKAIDDLVFTVNACSVHKMQDFLKKFKQNLDTETNKITKKGKLPKNVYQFKGK